MYVVFFTNGYALFDHSEIGKSSEIVKILQTEHEVHLVIDNKLYDKEGNEITDYVDVTDKYIDLSNSINDTLPINTTIELNLLPSEYAIYKDYLLVVKFNTDGNVKRLTFTEEGRYKIIALDRPCNGKTFYVVKPSVLIE